MPLHSLNSFIPNAMLTRWRKLYAPATLYQRRACLRRLLANIEQTRGARGLVSELARVPKPLPRETIATPQETERLLALAEPWYRCFLLSCIDLLHRSGTAIRFAPQHYHPETQTCRIRTKGGREIELPISPQLRELIEQAPPTDNPSIPFWKLLRGGHKLRAKSHRNMLDNRWLKLKRAAGVREQVRLHDLRRTTANRLMDTTGDIRLVSQALGHARLETTLGYLAHKDTEHLRRSLLNVWTPRGKEPLQ